MRPFLYYIHTKYLPHCRYTNIFKLENLKKNCKNLVTSIYIFQNLNNMVPNLNTYNIYNIKVFYKYL